MWDCLCEVYRGETTKIDPSHVSFEYVDRYQNTVMDKAKLVLLQLIQDEKSVLRQENCTIWSYNM